jgi:hypothetical protein
VSSPRAQDFLGLLEGHKEDLISDVFDLLMTIADFEAFKDVMLAYKWVTAAWPLRRECRGHGACRAALRAIHHRWPCSCALRCCCCCRREATSEGLGLAIAVTPLCIHTEVRRGRAARRRPGRVLGAQRRQQAPGSYRCCCYIRTCARPAGANGRRGAARPGPEPADQPHGERAVGRTKTMGLSLIHLSSGRTRVHMDKPCVMMRCVWGSAAHGQGRSAPGGRVAVRGFRLRFSLRSGTHCLIGRTAPGMH